MWTFEQWRDEFLGHESELIAEGAAILRAHDQNVAAVVKGASRGCSIWSSVGDVNHVHDWEGLAANCPPHLTSDVGHELANQSGTYGLLWYVGTANKVKCSLRSNGDYDVSAIAKAFGGGGHKNAAGFETTLEILSGWIGIEEMK